MMVKEVTFLLDDNAQMYTGNTVEIDVGSPNLPANEGGWLTGNDSVGNPLNRRIQGAGGVNRFRSQEIDGRIVLWASDAEIQAGKDNFAVMADGVTFEHIWSSWRGQRWVNRANVDDGLMSFKDLVDFHKDEVFSTFSLSTDSLTWIDENTLDLSNSEWLTLGLNPNYSMSFTYADSTTIVRGGGDNQSFGNRTVTLNWVQFTDSSGDVVVYEEGEMTEGLRVYDSNNTYEGRQETVVREELNYLTPGYGDGIVDFKIYHITSDDNVETGDIDEGANYWQIRQMTPSGSGVWTWLAPRYTNQIEADTALDEILAEYDALSAEAMVDVDARNAAAQAEANAAAMAAARDVGKEAKDKKDSWFSTIDKDDMKSLLFGGALVVLGVLLVSVLVKKGGGEGGE